jgi:hypothetical protein
LSQNAFARSRHALEQEPLLHAKWVLLPLSLIMLVWLGWFFLAQISLYELSNAQIQGDISLPKIVARFPAYVALVRIRKGQSAQFHINGFPQNQSGTVQAVVSSVSDQVDSEGQIEVHLDILPGASSLLPIRQGLQGSLTIEIEKISPAKLLLKTIVLDNS